MYFVPGREVVAVGWLVGLALVGLLVCWLVCPSVPGWVALFGGLKIDVFIK